MDRDFKKRERDEHVVDMLSAYIDNALDPGEREGVRAHIENCATCQTEHKSLLETQHMLKSLPVVPPPRAFTLTPEMVGIGARRESFWQRILTPHAVPRFATGSVVAFALLVLLLAGDLAGIRQNGVIAPYATSSKQVAPFEEQMAKRNAGAAVQAEATATTGAAEGNDTMAALAPPTVASLPPNTGGGIEPTPARGLANTTSSDTPELPTSAYATDLSPTEVIPGPDAMKQPGPDTYTYPGYVPSDAGQNSALPILEMALAAIGTLLAIGALIARRRGI